MARRLPSLNALRCFEIVADQMSIKKAANYMRISESAVSRQVRILEEQLGTPLFHRKHSGLEITDVGIALAASTKDAFSQIAKTIETFQRDKDTVQIKVLPTMALRWFYPRLKRFQSQYPLIQVIVQTRWHDMISGDGEAELGIRYGRGNWSPEYVTELYPEWLTPVCAPDYLNGRKLECAADFDKVTLLHPLPSHQDWKMWSERWGGESFNTEDGLDFDVLDMALRAAEAGFGITMSDVVLGADAIESGRLVTPVNIAVPSDISYYLVHPPMQQQRREVRLLREWICDEMSDTKRIISSYQ
ncbi:LysR substrate-binding domain-containing protein [Kordiimonas pumila]|uniref:LysR substrate-binding domain-containing protein n=1 Tax=Kordiimonas pumila TaxID=2161677 RepID=A0ABV7D554_9PROT|nr:LysR substrate-binding domain-containing protein [Kordiimonas pumila]